MVLKKPANGMRSPETRSITVSPSDCWDGWSALCTDEDEVFRLSWWRREMLEACFEGWNVPYALTGGMAGSWRREVNGIDGAWEETGWTRYDAP